MPPSKPKSPSAAAVDELITLVVARAPQLYAAGVVTFQVDGFAFTIGPPPPTIDKLPTAAPPVFHSDPLHDGATFPGGAVPGFMRPEDIAKKGLT